MLQALSSDSLLAIRGSILGKLSLQSLFVWSLCFHQTWFGQVGLVGFLDTRSLGMDGLMDRWEAALFLFLLCFVSFVLIGGTG